jgi:hypothetical protein
VLKYDDIVAQQQLLFAFYVHEEIGVFLVEIIDSHVLHATHRGDEPSIDSRFLKSRMRK